MIKDILKKHRIYIPDLELDLLRYFEKMRNEILKDLNSSHQADTPDRKHPATNEGKSSDDFWREYRTHRRAHPGR